MVPFNMEAHKMEEFRSNLLLLLQCGYPEGLPMNQLKSEYKQYFMEDVAPELILPRGYKNNKHWDTLFQMKEFREDFTLFYMGTAVYVKAIRKRNFAEMKLIAQLAKHSHLSAVRSGEFRCSCCPPELWKAVGREVVPVNSVIEVASVPGHQQEDIVVKIEHGGHGGMGMANGGEEDGNRPDGGIYSIVQQATHGNHQHQHHAASNYVNGGAVHDPSGSSASSTNDGFMLDHQLRVQEQSASQGSGLQAFASLLNSSGTGGQIPMPDAGNGNQPFYTFVIQNGEIKVMQIVSSEGTPANGEATAIPAQVVQAAATQASPTQPTAKKSLPQKRPAPSERAPVMPPTPASDPEHFVCSMPNCGESFEVKQHLQNHERTCSMKKYPCSFPGCDRRFKNSKQRHAHMTSRHKGTENAFRCSVPACTAVFKTSDRLKVHESRCRFKFEQFQLMDADSAAAAAAAALNNNDTTYTPSAESSIPNSLISNSEPQHSTGEPNAAFSTLQAAAIMTERGMIPVSVPTPTASVPQNNLPVKLENGNNNQPPTANNIVNPQTVQVIQHQQNPGEFQGFSTVDLSLVKSEIMEH